jgi:cytochrome d ubiquinol oxidase subunit II
MVTFWVAILALSMLLYVLLDGFELGVGILFGVFGGETERRTMMSAVAPVWDGNETWLVVTAVVLWGCFPLVYSILLSAFYLPLLLMLAALILRGVAFEYRARTQRRQWIWDTAFAGGSLVVAFMQGLTVGALVEGLPVAGTLIPAARSAGSARLHFCAGLGSVSATRCSAPAGWSKSVRGKCAMRLIA